MPEFMARLISRPISEMANQSPMTRSRLIPLTVAAALFMENMDSSVIATSLPAIAADLGEDPVILKLAFTAYLISFAVFIPLSAWLSAAFGAHNLFRAAIAMFTLASMACAAAWSLETLVAARALQGLGGAMMMPVGRAVMIRTIAKEDFVNAMAYVTIPALIGPLAGPLLGGFITTYFHWRWIFWINLPAGLLAFTMATLHMPDVRDTVRKLDLGEYLLASLGLAALVGGFTVFSGDFVPRWLAVSLAACGVVCIAAYVQRARRNPEPLADLNLLRIATLRSSLLGGMFFRAGAGAIAFLLPLMLQLGFGLTALQSGALTFVTAIGAIALKFTASPILRALGFKQVLIGNAVISACFLVGYGLLTPQTPHWIIFALLLVGGYFRSLQFTSLAAVAYADVKGEDTAQASMLFSVAQQFAISFGVAFAALVLDVSRGSGVLAPKDFTAAFFAMAALMLLAALAHRRLPANAAAHVSGKSVA